MTLRRALILSILLASAGLVAAKEDDLFAFIPPGGRTLLEAAEAVGLPPEFETALRSRSGDAAFWRARVDAAGGFGLQDWEAETLAQYLSVRAPLGPGAIPRDGRDLAMALCQSCHIITVVVTQKRTREAWLGTMKSPSHVEIAMTEAERGLLAEYLVLNAGIPIDQVPPELRAGGASY